jgi:hypothetical protein
VQPSRSFQSLDVADATTLLQALMCSDFVPAHLYGELKMDNQLDLQQLAENVQRLMDESAIRNVISTYARAVDR